MEKIIVYIGSFDPLHYGHIEAISLAHKFVNYSCKVLMLPNNPRKSKPNRSELLIRSHCLSTLYPIYSDNQWTIQKINNVIVDTRHVEIVTKELLNNNVKIIGLIGSDINHIPKLPANEWIIIERKGYTINSDIFDLFNVIPLNLSKYQFLSSTMIKNDELMIKYVPQSIQPYIKNNGLTLSKNILHHEYVTEKNSFTKVFKSNNLATEYYNKSILVSKDLVKPFVKADVINVIDNIVYEEYIKTNGSILDVIIDNDIVLLKKLMIIFFTNLNIFHSKQANSYIKHGDMSIANVHYIIDDDNGDQIKLILFDYEKITLCDKVNLIDDYNQFISSINFYLVRLGISDNITDKIKILGEKYYLCT